MFVYLLIYYLVNRTLEISHKLIRINYNYFDTIQQNRLALSSQIMQT